MEDFRSRSYGDGRMEMESYYGGGGTNGHSWEKPRLSNGNAVGNGVVSDLRCYSATYATSTEQQHQHQQSSNTQMPRELKKGKSTNGSVSSKAGWCFSDPELQRKKRVASYKSYSFEGKIKRSFSKSFRWLKDRYTHMVHGW